MSGCCGQGPVIVTGAAATPRLDVESVLLCDVLADGTVASLVLVEPIYDASTGLRVNTRTVDPATGAGYTPVGTLKACEPDGCTATTDSLILCDTAADGTTTHFVRSTTYDCTGALLATLDRNLDGTTYTPAGTVGVCPVAPDCNSPTEPTSTIGLCLADGTPIAVTVVRDCTGAVTSEGWINLTTGAWAAGAPPVGTVACGSSQSVQVSGTFCDVGAAGDVVGLVLVEYSYADDGTIASVRLVDATTGATYTPAGTITTCPVGVEQPEQELIQLCDIAADGTATPMLRDYRRDETGAIVGHSDYTPDGTAYTPTGTVGVCPTSCGDTETLHLCETATDGTVIPFLRAITYDCAGAVSSTFDSLDGTTAYTPTGTIGLCKEDCPTAAVQTFRLCDLNPAATPNADGLRCAVSFLRHFTYGCDGVATFHDTAMDGSTPYTPVEVVDCGENPPSLREQVWNTVSVAADPADATGATFLYTVANSEDPTQTGMVKMTASQPPSGGCATTPTAPVWNAGVTFVFEPDARILSLASVLRVDAIDWDGWEDKFIPSGGPASGGTWPIPDRVEADAGYTNISPTRWHSAAANNTGHFYFSGPPAAVAMGNRNDGGGLACVAPSFGFITLVPGPPCGATAEPCAKQIVERCGCDDTTGDGLGDVTYTELWAVDPCNGEAPELLGAYEDGDLTQPYTPIAPVECTAADQPPGPLSTGIRNVTGTAAQTLATTFPGLQSVSLTVLAGTVNVSMSDGTSVPVPAGVTLTWSVAKDEDNALAVAEFTGGSAASQYLLNYTFR